MRKLIFYKTVASHSPVEEFLDSLTSKHRQKAAWVFELIRVIPFVSGQYFKKLQGTDDIWEIRIDSGSDTFRILGFYDQGNLVILTNGFVKKTDRTPKNEIDLAESRKRDYERRRNG